MTLPSEELPKEVRSHGQGEPLTCVPRVPVPQLPPPAQRFGRPGAPPDQPPPGRGRRTHPAPLGGLPRPPARPRRGHPVGTGHPPGPPHHPPPPTRTAPPPASGPSPGAAAPCPPCP